MQPVPAHPGRHGQSYGLYWQPRRYQPSASALPSLKTRRRASQGGCQRTPSGPRQPPRELCNAGARLLLAPDQEVIAWTQAERAKGQAWGLKAIDTFHTRGTPPVDPETAPRTAS